MGKVIAVSGKGGVGKTLVATLLVRGLSEKKAGSILAIDADPDSNLAASLGVSYEKTMGDLREDITEKKIPPGVDKTNYLSGKAFEITVEADGFDLLVMGRPEGPGCYCALNHMLRNVIDSATSDYDYTVIDAEAGLEHLSRRTTKDVDVMLVVSDPSKKGLETAGKIKDLAKELDIKFGEIYLVLNRVKKGDEATLRKNAEGTGLPVLGEIPEDENVSSYDMDGKPLKDLPPDSPAAVGVTKILEEVAA